MQRTTTVIFIAILIALSCSKPIEPVFDNKHDPAYTGKDAILDSPDSLKITNMTETQVDLQWQYKGLAATSFEIEQSSSGITYRKVKDAVANVTTSSVTGIYYVDTTYYFRVRARSTYNVSGFSQSISKKLDFSPSNLTIANMTEIQVDLQWQDNSTFETGFEIEQSNDGTTYRKVKDAAANATAVSITGIYSTDTTYYFRVRAKSAYNVSGYSSPAIVSLLLVTVAGGTFTAGTTPVTISIFKMDKYEVTYELWTKVRNWALAHGYLSTEIAVGRNGYSPIGANNPVTEVNWYDVIKWCNARSEMKGLTPVYYTNSGQTTVYRSGQIDINIDAVKWTANGYRLPTETEWEFAARGGNQTHGYTYSGSNTIGDVAWYYTNSPNNTHTVGTKSANELGIYDMSGNVWEWCWDWYSGTYPSGATDPKGPTTTQTYRLLRGGSFHNDLGESYCRVVVRYVYDYPNNRNYGVGFRCVQD